MAASPFLFVGNLLCLDFLNTEPVREGVRVDLLVSFEDLARWLEAAGQLQPGAARTAAMRWGGSAEGRKTLREAKRLRAALRAMAERLAAGKPVGDDVVRTINRVLASRPAYARLVRNSTGYAARLEPVTRGPLQLLAPVAESAAWLLEHGEVSLVRQCEGNQCVLLFYDTTRNKSRRWCSMEECGGRAKAAAYYRRTRARGAPG